MGSNSNVNRPIFPMSISWRTDSANPWWTNKKWSRIGLFLIPRIMPAIFAWVRILCKIKCKNTRTVSTSFWSWCQGDNHQASLWKSTLTWLLKKYVDQRLPLITTIMNRSMAESVMSLCWKRCTMTILLKTTGLDKEDIKNDRSISNFPFIFNPIEKVAARRIEENLEHNDLNDTYQSAYRRCYSTFSWKCKVTLLSLFMKDPWPH